MSPLPESGGRDAAGGSRGRSDRARVFLMSNNLETGGSERQFSLMAQALRDGEFEVELGCLGRSGAFLAGLGPISEFRVGGSFLSVQAWKSRFALRRHLRRQEISVAHSFDFYTNLMLIPTARLAGVPAVIGSQRQLGDLLPPMKRAVQARILGLCDRVVCNSRAASNLLREQGVAARKLAVIPNGLPAEAFAETPPALPQRPGVLRVGVLARMNEPVKNHPVFLRAVARLLTKFPTLEILLVGDGALRPGLEKLAAELGFGERACFLGDRRDIPAVLASMDLSVLPSHSESLSNAIMESMAAGKAVVACRVGGNPDLVRENETGLLVPPNDEQSLAEAIEYLLQRPELVREWGRRGKEVALASFTVQRAREQYEQLYTDVLVEKGRLTRLASRAADSSAARPMRVVIVGPSLQMIGGQSVQADLLLRNWQHDPAVDVRFIPVDTPFPRGLQWASRIPFLRTAIRTPLYLRALYRGLADADLAHIYSASYWSFLLAPAPALWIAKRLGKRALINYHSGEARDHLERWGSALSTLRKADGLAVPSQFLADVFQQFGLRARVVANLVDSAQFSWRPRQPLRPRLVCTRGFEPYYSVDVVVRAFAEVKRSVPEASLYLVGGGSLEQEIHTLVQELGLADVEFAGPVSRDGIGRYYDAADIFINASWLDNMPGSILEAFTAGTVVVSTAPEGIRYLVAHERTGLLSDPGDAQALARNVLRVLREPELAARLARNAAEESKRYHWDSVRTEWLALYRSVLGLPPLAAGGEPALAADTQEPERNLFQCRP
ncbi:MAG: glycosyltransferase [Acidobacteria bacterium]|nr:glycosyltransferase [Acidobacteriota bacterium]